VLKCAAVCCSVLQCVAVCCSVLQCVAVCCSLLQSVAVCRSLLRSKICREHCLIRPKGIFVLHWFLNVSCLYGVCVCIAVCCSVLQCVAVCVPLFQLSSDYVGLCVWGGGGQRDGLFQKETTTSPVASPTPLAPSPLSLCSVSAGKQEAGDVCVWHGDRVLQGVAVCCRVLQSVAECCSVLQCVAVCCSV